MQPELYYVFCDFLLLRCFQSEEAALKYIKKESESAKYVKMDFYLVKGTLVDLPEIDEFNEPTKWSFKPIDTESNSLVESTEHYSIYSLTDKEGYVGYGIILNKGLDTERSCVKTFSIDKYSSDELAILMSKTLTDAQQLYSLIHPSIEFCLI